jgi:hypothetical protein
MGTQADHAGDTLLIVDPDTDFLDWAAKHLAADNLRILRCNDAAR